MRSDGLFECFGHACLDSLSSLSRHLLGERAEFLILRGRDFELLAHLRGRQLDKFRRRLHTQQLMDVVKGGPSVGMGNLNKLVIVVCGTLGSSLVGMIEEVGRFFAGYFGFRASVLGTLETLF